MERIEIRNFGPIQIRQSFKNAEKNPVTATGEIHQWQRNGCTDMTSL